MIKKIILTLVCILLPNIVTADELQLQKDAPSKYVVKKGDTLWDISGVFLEQPWLWPKLWRINPEIENPHLIYPGDELRLVYDENGQPMLVKEEPEVEEKVIEPAKPAGKQKLKWSPTARTTLKDINPVTTMPLHVIAPYVKYSTIFSVAELESAPYVIGSDEGYVRNIAGFKTYTNGDLEVGQSYAVYTKRKQIVDPETAEIIGYHATLVGTGKATVAGDKEAKVPATLFLKGSNQEVRAGDIVKPVNEGQLLPSFYTMQLPDESVNGSIVESATGLREFGKFEVVYLNRGASHMVKAGDVLTVKRKSPGVVETENGPVYVKDASRWAKLSAEGSQYNMPEESLGQMMVFKVFDEMSMAIILNSEKPLRLKDTFSAL